jgi:hypothetical protein
MKEIKVFMRISSFGVVFVIFLMLYIITTGIISLSDTTFQFGTTAESNLTDWNESVRTLVLFNTNFSPLAGILCTGYFLHTCSLPIIRVSKNPEKKGRDLFYGYLLVFISYAIVGVLGYIGFIGYSFKGYYLGELSGKVHD